MSDQESANARLSRPVVIALAGVVVIAVAIGLSIWSSHKDEAPPAQAPSAANSAPSTNDQAKAPSAAEPSKPAASTTAANADAAPSFDVVRIARDGRAVIAGRAAPGATVIILDGDKEVGRVKANSNGEWVFTPDKPLEPGSIELGLRAENPGGGTKEGDAPVVLVVPERKVASGGGAPTGDALAVKVKPGGAVQLLQVPSSHEGSGQVAVEVVNFDEKGHLSVGGHAPPNATLQVYLDNQPIGSTTADGKGEWSLTVDHPLSDGSHTIRADQANGQGKVVARAEITFTAGGGGPVKGNITVATGNSLWRIARHAYGNGFNYITIFNANKDQIRNPDMIYPGQIFKLPTKG